MANANGADGGGVRARRRQPHLRARRVPSPLLLRLQLVLSSRRPPGAHGRACYPCGLERAQTEGRATVEGIAEISDDARVTLLTMPRLPCAAAASCTLGAGV